MWQYKTELIQIIFWVLFLLIVVADIALSCDGEFLYEPTTREPDNEEVNTWAGTVSRTWKFLDGRTLTTVYIITHISTEETVETLPNPLFYIVTDKTHTSITYIDPEGNGQCYDIRRY